MTVDLLYFAWVRERIGKPSERLELPAEVRTVADLARWLAGRGPEYAAAFEKPEIVRAAINQVHVKPGASLDDAREIAFFPPVTGG
ncbi:MAG: molybdopterin converting factor subunit 1 [Hyphomicrobiaceae bacterium]